MSVVAVLFSATLTLVAQGSASADVTAVSGSACGYFTNVGLFGGPLARRGCGQPGVTPTSTSYSPSVTLPPTGSGPITGSDPDGAVAQYGPAKLLSGQYPNVANDPAQQAPSPPTGPQNVSTQGTTGPAGSATSSASITQGTQGVADPKQPRGIGPGPVVADAVSSTCTASQSAVTGSTTFVNGVLVTSTVVGGPNDGGALTSEPIPANPPPNYTRSGAINNVGDFFTVVFNEQVIGPDSITVNAVHLYLLGPTAVGEFVIAQSHCDVTSTVPNAAPVANNDSYFAAPNTPLTVPAPGVLANDSDPNGDPLTATNAQAVFVPGPNQPYSSGNTFIFPSQPTACAPAPPGSPCVTGTVTINPDGSFTYTPPPNFVGTDSFKYVARDPRGANSTATVTINVVPPDLAVNKTCGPSGVVPSKNLTCQITVTNNGPSAAPNVVVTDTAPAGTTPTSLSSTAGAPFTCTLAALSCTTPSLAAGQSTTITVVSRVSDTVGPNTPLSDTATATTTTTDSNPANNSFTATPRTAACTITGTADADIIIATTGNQVICGLGGDDYIVAKGSNNVIFGGTGNDILTGGSGNDVILGGDGDDTINGGGGVDSLFGQAGNDTLNAKDRAGGDIVDGGPGPADTCSADPGDVVTNCEF